jgi:hypothetical protein
VFIESSHDIDEGERDEDLGSEVNSDVDSSVSNAFGNLGAINNETASVVLPSLAVREST